MKIICSILFFCCVFCVNAQSDWQFGFYIVEDDIETVSSNYHATNFNINADSTFIYGLSEAQESGVILNDSSLNLRVYDYSSGNGSMTWSNSLEIFHLSEKLFILKGTNTEFKIFGLEPDDTSTVYMFYFKSEIRFTKRKAKRYYRKYKRSA